MTNVTGRCRTLGTVGGVAVGNFLSMMIAALALGAAGCAGPGIDPGGDTGGTPGSGGAPNPSSGGAPGSGGAPNPSSGGAPGSGGAPNPSSGGAPGSGGRQGSGGALGSGGAASGGRSGSGGAATGGAATGGRPGSGGAATGGAATGGRPGSGGASSGGSSGTTTGGCTTIGSSMTVNSTIVVKSGTTYDGGCKRFIAGSALGDGSQAEGQDPVFDVENNGTLINVVLGFPAADGVHTLGSATLRNITWEDIGEDAMTMKGPGTVTLDGGSSQKGSDKTFQINAAGTFRVSNFKAKTAGKFIRQNGDTTFKISVFIDKCDIADMDEAIFRTDSSSSTVSMTNTRYHNIGDSLFIGVAAGNITQSGNTEY